MTRSQFGGLNVWGAVLGWLVAPQKICPCPYPRNWCMWPYMEKYFADVINIKMWRWGNPSRIGQTLNPMTSPLRNRREDTQCGGERSVNTEVEAGIMQPQAKEHLKRPEAGRSGVGFSSGVFRGSVAMLPPWFRMSSFQNCQRLNFCYFKPPSS